MEKIKIIQMANKRYMLNFTEATHRIINALEEREYKVRDVLNAGVVLFDQASMAQRGQAQVISHGMAKEDIITAIGRIKQTIDWMDGIKQPEAFSETERELARQLKDILRPIESLMDSGAIVDATEAETKETRKKQDRRAAKRRQSAG